MRNYIVNERIRAREVRLIDETGKQLGIVPTAEALRVARERGYDLVLISLTSAPQVARITDLGKLKYEESKKEKEARKASRGGGLKEVKISPKIADHDLNVRILKAKELLEKKHKVKVTMFFRGRENIHTEIGEKIMDRFLAAVLTKGKIDEPPKKVGKNLYAILSPQ